MKTLLIIIGISVICLSCGKKDSPEYQAVISSNPTVFSR